MLNDVHFYNMKKEIPQQAELDIYFIKGTFLKQHLMKVCDSPRSWKYLDYADFQIILARYIELYFQQALPK